MKRYSGGMFRLRPLVLFLPLLLLSACGEFRPPGEREQLLVYVVRPGDTLYSISWRYGYDYREVASWNGIASPYTIKAGQKIRLISPYQQTAPKARPATGAKSNPVPPKASRSNTPSAPADGKVSSSSSGHESVKKKPPEKAAPQPVRKSIAWRWPTEGKVVTPFSPTKGKKGVDIFGKQGQSIVAAAAGEVVYSGDGLIGYGKLVIIKHDDTYLSAYGHNRRLLVKEGQSVKQGQRIAELGGTRKGGSILHFEIRRDGKPVNPLRYLPEG